MLDTLNLLNILPRIQIEKMPKISKAKKKKLKIKVKSASKIKPKIVSKPKETNKGPVKISKTYIPKDTEKYMCEKHKVYFQNQITRMEKRIN